VDTPSSPFLEDLISAMPGDGPECRRRLALAHAALLQTAPHLAAGGPEAVRPQDLRSISLALDLFVFASRYQTAFENWGRVQFAWALDDSSSGPDARLERFHEGNIMIGEEDSNLFEFHVAPGRIAQAASGEAPGDLVDGLLRAMLRLMVLAAAVCTEECTEAGTATAVWMLRRLRGEP